MIARAGSWSMEVIHSFIHSLEYLSSSWHLLPVRHNERRVGERESEQGALFIRGWSVCAQCPPSRLAHVQGDYTLWSVPLVAMFLIYLWNSVFQLGYTVASVLAHQPMEHFKHILQDITTDRMLRQIRRLDTTLQANPLSKALIWSATPCLAGLPQHLPNYLYGWVAQLSMKVD